MSDLIWTPTSERLAALDWYTVNERGLHDLPTLQPIVNIMAGKAWPGVLYRGAQDDGEGITTLLSMTPVEGVAKFKQRPATHYMPPAFNDLRGVVYQYAFYNRYLRQVTQEGRLIHA